MQDSPLFGQIHLGYTPVVSRGGHVGGLQLTLMPSRTLTRLDAAGLLGLLCQAFMTSDTDRVARFRDLRAQDVSLVWSVPGAAARSLARVAVRRGLALAELARMAGQEDLRDEMFICGVMSLLDRMTGLSFDELAGLVPMPARVQASLQRVDGPSAQHLSLMSAVEHASFAEMDEVADTLLIGLGDLNRAVLSALAAAHRLEA
jgi:hypothetical protein